MWYRRKVIKNNLDNPAESHSVTVINKNCNLLTAYENKILFILIPFVVIIFDLIVNSPNHITSIG